MGTTTLIARIALATVFVVSGIAKLTDRDGTRQAVAGFGVPSRMVGLVALALAPVELVVALLLLPERTAVVGLALSVAILAAFTLAVILSLRAGRRPECHCFGRIGGADVSWRTVARNVVLAGLAIIGLIAARSPELVLTGGEATFGVVSGLAAAGLVLLAEGLAGRAAKRARERGDEAAYERGMSPGAESMGAFAFRAETLAGPAVSLDDLRTAGLPVLLVFLSAGCGPCKSFRPAVTRWSDVYRGRVTVAVVAGGGLAANLASYDKASDMTVLLDDDDAIRNGFEIIGTPAAVLVEPDGRLRGGVIASGERLVRRLLAAALAGTEIDASHHHERAEGVPAESLELSSVPRPRLTVTAHQVGDETVLVDEAEGASLSLDHIGGIVWSVLDGISPLDEVVTDLADVFGAPSATVGPDVLEMVRTLGRAGMLEGVAPEAHSDEVETVEAAPAPTG